MPNQIRANRQRYEDKYWCSGWTSPNGGREPNGEGREECIAATPREKRETKLGGESGEKRGSVALLRPPHDLGL